MSSASSVMDSSTLREHLMAPEPMPRVKALHELEVIGLKTAGSASRAALSQAVARFVERGIPYYPKFRS